MSNEHEEQVPGVTLFFKRSSFGKPQADEKFRIELTLDCSVRDETLWPVVEEKFKAGLRVFTREDFHMEVMDVLREKLMVTEGKLAASERELRQTRDELAKYKEPLTAFGRALRGG